LYFVLCILRFFFLLLTVFFFFIYCHTLSTSALNLFTTSLLFPLCFAFAHPCRMKSGIPAPSALGEMSDNSDPINRRLQR
jgi:hypothetical protein